MSLFSKIQTNLKSSWSDHDKLAFKLQIENYSMLEDDLQMIWERRQLWRNKKIFLTKETRQK